MGNPLLVVIIDFYQGVLVTCYRRGVVVINLITR